MTGTTYINGSAALRSFMQGIHSRVNSANDLTIVGGMSFDRR